MFVLSYKYGNIRTSKRKINLTLDITGESGGFHLLDMLVATIGLFDDVKITYRADDKIECVQDGEIADEKTVRTAPQNL